MSAYWIKNKSISLGLSTNVAFPLHRAHLCIGVRRLHQRRSTEHISSHKQELLQVCFKSIDV